MTNQPGIYRIVNTVSGRTYLGSSVRVQSRLSIHKRTLQLGVHRNHHLQSSWNKYGSESFTFEHLCSCDRANLVSREQMFIDAYVEHGMPVYNKKPSFESQLGFRYEASASARAKLSAAHKGKPKPSHLADMLRSRLKGIPKTFEHRQKLRLAQTGKILSADHKAKIGAGGKGKKMSLASKARLSIAQKMRLSSLAARSRMMGMKGKHHSVATRIKISESKRRGQGART